MTLVNCSATVNMLYCSLSCAFHLVARSEVLTCGNLIFVWPDDVFQGQGVHLVTPDWITQKLLGKVDGSGIFQIMT